MPRDLVPTGEERQALFDQLSDVFRRCSEQAVAIADARDDALAAIPEARPAIARREQAVADASDKAAIAEDKADRALTDAVEAGDRDFFDAAQAADAKRQQAAIAADREQDQAIDDAAGRYEATIRAIHAATVGLQAIADAEKRAADERDKSVRDARQDFRDAIGKADADRQNALDTALSRQIAVRAAADDARSRSSRDAQAVLAESIRAADRTLADTLNALPAAKRVLDTAAERRRTLDRACDEEKRAIEAKLRGDG